MTGIHIRNPAPFEDDGDDDYAASKSAAERTGEIRSEVLRHKERREANARKPKTIGDIDVNAVYRKFNSARSSKTLTDTNGADED